MTAAKIGNTDDNVASTGKALRDLKSALASIHPKRKFVSADILEISNWRAGNRRLQKCQASKKRQISEHLAFRTSSFRHLPHQVNKLSTITIGPLVI